MPETITLGHLLVLAGIADGLVAALLGVRVSRLAGHAPGSPEETQAAATRRTALIVLVSALVLIVLGLVSPLGGIVLIGEGA